MGAGSGRFSQQDMVAALRASGIGIWRWNAVTGALQWSPEAERIFGLESGAFGGTFDSFMELVHPDDRATVEGAIERSRENPLGDYRVEHRIVVGEGEVRWVDSSAQALVDDDGHLAGMLGTTMDVTPRREAEEQLRESEERLRLFSELVTDYLYVVDVRRPSMFPHVVVGSFEGTTGYTPNDIAELGGWLEIMHPDDRGNVEELMGVLQRGSPFVNEYRITTKGGEVRWLRDRARPILDEDGELAQIVGGVQDITDRKNLEERLISSQRMEALARLAGGVAHDFNNLMTVMLSSVSLLKRAPLANERSERALQDLEHVIGRACELTGSLLTLGRRQIQAPQALSLTQLIDRARRVLERAVGERVTLELDVAANLDVWADGAQLELALLNLCLNARDAMPEGGRLTLEAGAVELDAKARKPAELSPGSYVVIKVRDTGHGIAPEDLPRIFEPFFSTKSAGRGTGLGLATVYGIVRAANGVIDVASSPSGTTFSIFLPPTAEPSRPVRKTRLTGHATGGSESILVVEDEAIVRKQVQRILDELGYRVVAVDSSEAALALGDELLATFDLLLTDVRLPGEPGTELAVTLKERRGELRVLLMSGYVEEARQRLVVESERFAYLAKPFTPEGLARRVREVLESEVTTE